MAVGSDSAVYGLLYNRNLRLSCAIMSSCVRFKGSPSYSILGLLLFCTCSDEAFIYKKLHLPTPHTIQSLPSTLLSPIQEVSSDINKGTAPKVKSPVAMLLEAFCEVQSSQPENGEKAPELTQEISDNSSSQLEQNLVHQDDPLSPQSQHKLAIAEVHGTPIPDLHLKLWDIFEDAATLYPEHDALVSLWQPQDPLLNAGSLNTSRSQTLRWSYSQLKERAEKLSTCLKKMGCRPGMRLAVVLWNSAEWGLFFWAAARLQMAFCPIDPTVSKDAKATVLLLQPQVVVVQNSDIAISLDLIHAQLEAPGFRIHCAAEEVDGWTRLCSLPTVSNAKETMFTSNDLSDGLAIEDTTALIVFTSGTTGEPKGCVHTHQNIVSQCCDFDPEVDPKHFLCFLVHTPVSHIFAINNCLRAWRWGGAVVFPSKSFDVTATLHALVQEQCSVMSATPTLVKALLDHPSFPSPEKFDLRIVTIGGTSIGREDIRLCCEGLGAKVAIQVYGMSEGAPLITFARSDPDYAGGYHPGVGKILPGAKARICRPGSREILRRGDIGELHVGGTSIITRYFNRERDPALYNDGTVSWLVTGDQAKIDERGIIYILGRYKDLIIRGGENIYPIRIESALQQVPGVQLQAQVVGIPDDLAGQVPVAVVIMPKETSKAQLIDISRSVDPRYTLSTIYTIEDLGLEKFPVTSLGKVKKALLRERLEQLHRSKQSGSESLSQDAQPSQKYVSKLLGIWEQLCGTRPSQCDNIAYLADSITLLRYCDEVLHTCGQRLYLQDFADNETVEKQAHLLLTREIRQVTLNLAQGSLSRYTQPIFKAPICSIQYSPPVAGIYSQKNPRLLLMDDDEIWRAARSRVSDIGFSKADIEDVMVIRDSLHRTAVGLRPQSYHNRTVFRVREIPYEKIRRGLEKALATRPLLRALMFETANRVPYHAILQSSPALLVRLIHDSQVLAEADALERAKNETSEDHSSPFMFQSNIVQIGSGDHYFLIFTFSHSVIDALSVTQWLNELDRWIQDSNLELPSLTPYCLFNDLFSQYGNSDPARASVAFHVKRLRGISRFRRALWPPQRAPGMMISSDQGSPYVSERRNIRNQVWAGKWERYVSAFQFPRSGRVVALPGLASLIRTHGIIPSLFTKGAIVLFNVLQTGSSHALFTSWESGRSWPFVPPWMESLLPPAMSIDGPTVQWLLNMCEVIHDETCVEFLQRVASEHEQIKQFEHVPWNCVLRGLRDEGDMAELASFRQSFVWDMSMAMNFGNGNRRDFKTLEPVARYDWPDCGLCWNAFMLDSVNLYFIASWDTAQLNEEEVDRYCDELAEVTRKLADAKNWHKKIREVFTW
ncbi:hypothetical protein BGZ63DRAFT_461888 [Mariannaea sp. PMI_226]|nr:hypothetical protein BGZ63DRAFT_461888 [Mariannaea sp. PMI_226]